MGTWLNTQKSVTSWSTGSGDAVLISLSELRWKNKVFYVALLYQFPKMEMIKVHPPDMEAFSWILNTLFPFSFLGESKSSLPHAQESTFYGKEVIRDLSTLGLYFPAIYSLDCLESTMISVSFTQKLLNVRPCGCPLLLWFAHLS